MSARVYDARGGWRTYDQYGRIEEIGWPDGSHGRFQAANAAEDQRLADMGLTEMTLHPAPFLASLRWWLRWVWKRVL